MAGATPSSFLSLRPDMNSAAILQACQRTQYPNSRSNMAVNSVSDGKSAVFLDHSAYDANGNVRIDHFVPDRVAVALVLSQQFIRFLRPHDFDGVVLVGKIIAWHGVGAPMALHAQTQAVCANHVRKNGFGFLAFVF